MIWSRTFGNHIWRSSCSCYRVMASFVYPDWRWSADYFAPGTHFPQHLGTVTEGSGHAKRQAAQTLCEQHAEKIQCN